MTVDPVDRGGATAARSLASAGGFGALLRDERSAQARLEVIEPGGTRRIVAVPTRGLRMGRAPDQDVQVDVQTVSKHHASVLWRGDDLYMRDEGSCNGTRRDGERLSEPIRLSDGDELVLGGTVVVRVHIDAAQFGEPASQLPEGEGLAASVLAPAVQPMLLNLLPIIAKIYRAASYEELGMQLTRAAGEQLQASRVALLDMQEDRFRVLGLYNGSQFDPRALHDAGFVSRTVVDQAMKEGVVHYREGVIDPSASMISSGARSATAAAIRCCDGRTRVLYMDSIGSDPMLTASHARALELLAAHAAGAFDTLDARFGSAHERMRFQQLRRYFSADVVEHILASPEDVVAKPRNVEATVVFADLVGYTKLSERLRDQPELLMNLLNSWLDAGAEAVIANRGTLDKFIGDCVMAVFGAPFAQPQSELRAVRCALDMTRAVQEISAKTGERLEITVGINSGWMLAGSVGSRRRLEYTVLGDTVNVASRLQSAAVAGEILIGPDTASRLQGAVQLQDAGVRTLKNHGPVQAYRVIGLDAPDTTELPVELVAVEDTLR